MDNKILVVRCIEYIHDDNDFTVGKEYRVYSYHNEYGDYRLRNNRGWFTGIWRGFFEIVGYFDKHDDRFKSFKDENGEEGKIGSIVRYWKSNERKTVKDIVKEGDKTKLYFKEGSYGFASNYQLIK